MKKKARLTINQLIIGLLTIFVGSIVIAFLTGSFPIIKEYVASIGSPIKIGQPEVAQIEVQIPRSLELAFDNLFSTLNEGAKSKDKECLIPYQELPSFENNCQIALGYEKDYNRMRIEVRCPDKQGIPRVVKESIEELRPNIHPCLVAGRGIDEEGNEYIAADNFFNNWIGKNTPKKHPEMTLEKKGIIITDKTSLIMKGKSYSLYDKNEQISYLYKANPNSICFFTTNKVTNHDESGIDNDYIKDIANYVPLCKVI